MDCPDVSPKDKPLVCRLNVKIDRGQNVTAFVNYGDGVTKEITISKRSTFIEHSYRNISKYIVNCTVPFFNISMRENVEIRRMYTVNS